MKKWFLIIFTLLFIAICSIYFFIPSRQTIAFETPVNGVQSGIERILLDKTKLPSWWPGKQEDTHNYNYKNYHYRVDNFLLNGIELNISNGKDSINGMLQTIPAKNNTLLRWTSPVALSANPITRLLQYYSFVDFKKNIESLFAALKNHFENEEHIYGIKVLMQKVTDSTMISLKQTFDHYPATPEIYTMINSVKQFIAAHGGEENNYPMLNIHPEDSLSYEVMVAIPTKRNVMPQGQFALKNMVLGNILMAEVKGGVYTVKEAERQLFNYLNDYHRSSPAIPYQSLVTNRLTETDTSKWITRLYYPIF